MSSMKKLSKGITLGNAQFELKILDDRIREWGIPNFQTDMSAGIDVHACIDAPLELRPQADAILIPTGVAILMNDPNVVAFLLARSGLGHKKGVILGQLDLAQVGHDEITSLGF